MIDHLQINDVAPCIHYDCNGVQAAFTFPFAVFKIADLEVWVNQVRATSGYTVSGAGISSGGSVLFAVPPAQGVRLTLRRRLALARVTDFQTDGIIRAKTLNDEMDYQVAALQQVADDVSRCIQRPFTSGSTADLRLPDPAAGKAIGWNAAGTALVNDPADFAATVVAVTAKAAEAETSRSAAAAAASAAAADRASVAADRSVVASNLTATANHRTAANAAAIAAATSETNAAASRTSAAGSASAAAASETAAAASRDAAAASASAAASAKTQATTSRDAAAASASTAATAEANALGHKNAAANSAASAQTYANQAQAAANIQTFSTLAVAGQPSIVADLAGDTLTLSAGSNIAISTNAATDTLTVAVTGLANVAKTGVYGDLSGRPSLGTAAAANLGTGAGQIPTADQIAVLAPAAPLMGYSTMQKFTASGVFSVPAGVTAVFAEVIGGGGSGAGYNGSVGARGGGGGGGYARKRITGLTPGQSIAVTVGAGGAGVGSGMGGNAGGTSSFGAFVSATGGAGGDYTNGIGGIGGEGVGGDVNVRGDAGHAATGETVRYGGGSSFYGAGAAALPGWVGGGSSASEPGAGGGAMGSTGTSGAGAPGFVLVYWRV